MVIHEKLVAAGIDIDLATPGGVRPTIDPHSMKPAANGEDRASKVAHFTEYLATPSVAAALGSRSSSPMSTAPLTTRS